MNNNLMKKLSARTKYYLIFMLAISIMLPGISSFDAKATTGKLETQNNQAGQKSAYSAEWERLTVWNIIEMNDWFLWPFIIITAYGLMLNIHRILMEHRDKSRSEPLLQGKIRATGLRGLVQLARTSRPNRAARLFYQIVASFEKSNQSQSISDEINQFVTAENDSFERFNRVNGFLSEAAGALGLLGTVWGIFVTFYSARMDGPTILRGMSIALVTTLTGLIISLVLNSCGTYLYTLFNRQLNLITTKAEELKQALLYLQKKSANETHPVINEKLDDLRVVTVEPQLKKESRERYVKGIALAEV